MLRIFFIVSSSMMILFTASSQPSYLSQFNAAQNGSSVFLNFTIASGITCLGIEIERSSDGIAFNTIGIIPGICGNSSEATTYSFEDTSPLKNIENYYRLLLGQVGYSQTIPVQFIDYDNNAVIFPNPIVDQSKIYFPNPKSESFIFRLFDEQGRLIGTGSTTNAYILIKREALSSGIYLFMLQNELLEYKGKFVVQ